MIQLSDHFNYWKLLRFTLPSIIMMIFTSIYSVVDGIFVSNFAGKTPFAAINLIMPLLIVTGAPGFMVGTGGSAIVAKTMGQGKPELAKRYFSLQLPLPGLVRHGLQRDIPRLPAGSDHRVDGGLGDRPLLADLLLGMGTGPAAACQGFSNPCHRKNPAINSA